MVVILEKVTRILYKNEKLKNKILKLLIDLIIFDVKDIL